MKEDVPRAGATKMFERLLGNNTDRTIVMSQLKPQTQKC